MKNSLKRGGKIIIEVRIKIKPGNTQTSYGISPILDLIIFFKGEPIIAKIVNGNNI